MNSPHTSVNTPALRTYPPVIFSNYQRQSNFSQDFPLKLVVNAKYIGAIIGVAGANIREISKVSKARCMVDVNNPSYDESANLEKLIWITGHMDNCSKACYSIIKIIQKEIEKEKNSNGLPIELKLRVPNQLVGRLIGKGGSSIKRIMEETGVSISISESRNSVDAMYVDPTNFERIITIRSNTIDSVSSAEKKISQKLRFYFESDVNAGIFMHNYPNPASLFNIPSYVINTNSVAMNRAPPTQAVVCTNSGNYSNAIQPHSSSSSSGGVFPFGVSHPPPPLHQPPALLYPHIPLNSMAMNLYPHKQANHPIHIKSRIYVPNSVVGALIGAKGTYIRNMVNVSGANIHIKGGLESVVNENSNNVNPNERYVAIQGLDFQVYKAQFCIFQKVAETTHQFIDEMVLTAETMVPSKVVGRIIGRSGQNVRELQRITQASVRIPDELNPGENSENSPPTNHTDETPVRIVGNFFSLQSVQARFSTLIVESEGRQNRYYNFSAENKFAPSNNNPSNYEEGNYNNDQNASSDSLSNNFETAGDASAAKTHSDSTQNSQYPVCYTDETSQPAVIYETIKAANNFNAGGT